MTRRSSSRLFGVVVVSLLAAIASAVSLEEQCLVNPTHPQCDAVIANRICVCAPAPTCSPPSPCAPPPPCSCPSYGPNPTPAPASSAATATAPSVSSSIDYAAIAKKAAEAAVQTTSTTMPASAPAQSQPTATPSQPSLRELAQKEAAQHLAEIQTSSTLKSLLKTNPLTNLNSVLPSLNLPTEDLTAKMLYPKKKRVAVQAKLPIASSQYPKYSSKDLDKLMVNVGELKGTWPKDKSEKPKRKVSKWAVLKETQVKRKNARQIRRERGKKRRQNGERGRKMRRRVKRETRRRRRALRAARIRRGRTLAARRRLRRRKARANRRKMMATRRRERKRRRAIRRQRANRRRQLRRLRRAKALKRRKLRAQKDRKERAKKIQRMKLHTQSLKQKFVKQRQQERIRWRKRQVASAVRYHRRLLADSPWWKDANFWDAYVKSKDEKVFNRHRFGVYCSVRFNADLKKHVKAYLGFLTRLTQVRDLRVRTFIRNLRSASTIAQSRKLMAGERAAEASYRSFVARMKFKLPLAKVQFANNCLNDERFTKWNVIMKRKAQLENNFKSSRISRHLARLKGRQLRDARRKLVNRRDIDKFEMKKELFYKANIKTVHFKRLVVRERKAKDKKMLKQHARKREAMKRLGWKRIKAQRRERQRRHLMRTRALELLKRKHRERRRKELMKRRRMRMRSDELAFKNQMKVYLKQQIASIQRMKLRPKRVRKSASRARRMSRRVRASRRTHAQRRKDRAAERARRARLTKYFRALKKLKTRLTRTKRSIKRKYGTLKGMRNKKRRSNKMNKKHRRRMAKIRARLSKRLRKSGQKVVRRKKNFKKMDQATRTKLSKILGDMRAKIAVLKNKIAAYRKSERLKRKQRSIRRASKKRHRRAKRRLTAKRRRMIRKSKKSKASQKSQRRRRKFAKLRMRVRAKLRKLSRGSHKLDLRLSAQESRGKRARLHAWRQMNRRQYEVLRSYYHDLRIMRIRFRQALASRTLRVDGAFKRRIDGQLKTEAAEKRAALRALERCWGETTSRRRRVLSKLRRQWGLRRRQILFSLKDARRNVALEQSKVLAPKAIMRIPQAARYKCRVAKRRLRSNFRRASRRLRKTDRRLRKSLSTSQRQLKYLQVRYRFLRGSLNAKNSATFKALWRRNRKVRRLDRKNQSRMRRRVRRAGRRGRFGRRLRRRIGRRFKKMRRNKRKLRRRVRRNNRKLRRQLRRKIRAARKTKRMGLFKRLRRRARRIARRARRRVNRGSRRAARKAARAARKTGRVVRGIAKKTARALAKVTSSVSKVVPIVLPGFGQVSGAKGDSVAKQSRAILKAGVARAVKQLKAKVKNMRALRIKLRGQIRAARQNFLKQSKAARMACRRSKTAARLRFGVRVQMFRENASKREQVLVRRKKLTNDHLRNSLLRLRLDKERFRKKHRNENLRGIRRCSERQGKERRRKTSEFGFKQRWYRYEAQIRRHRNVIALRNHFSHWRKKMGEWRKYVRENHAKDMYARRRWSRVADRRDRDAESDRRRQQEAVNDMIQARRANREKDVKHAERRSKEARAKAWFSGRRHQERSVKEKRRRIAFAQRRRRFRLAITRIRSKMGVKVRGHKSLVRAGRRLARRLSSLVKSIRRRTRCARSIEKAAGALRLAREYPQRSVKSRLQLAAAMTASRKVLEQVKRANTKELQKQAKFNALRQLAAKNNKKVKAARYVRKIKKSKDRIRSRQRRVARINKRLVKRRAREAKIKAGFSRKQRMWEAVYAKHNKTALKCHSKTVTIVGKTKAHDRLRRDVRRMKANFRRRSRESIDTLNLELSRLDHLKLKHNKANGNEHEHKQKRERQFKNAAAKRNNKLSHKVWMKIQDSKAQKAVLKMRLSEVAAKRAHSVSVEKRAKAAWRKQIAGVRRSVKLSRKRRDEVRRLTLVNRAKQCSRQAQFFKARTRAAVMAARKRTRVGVSRLEGRLHKVKVKAFRKRQVWQSFRSRFRGRIERLKREKVRLEVQVATRRTPVYRRALKLRLVQVSGQLQRAQLRFARTRSRYLSSKLRLKFQIRLRRAKVKNAKNKLQRTLRRLRRRRAGKAKRCRIVIQRQRRYADALASRQLRTQYRIWKNRKSKLLRQLRRRKRKLARGRLAVRRVIRRRRQLIRRLRVTRSERGEKSRVERLRLVAHAKQATQKRGQWQNGERQRKQEGRVKRHAKRHGQAPYENMFSKKGADYLKLRAKRERQRKERAKKREEFHISTKKFKKENPIEAQTLGLDAEQHNAEIADASSDIVLFQLE